MYAAAQQPRTPASPKMRMSMTVTDSSLVGTDLAVFTGLLLKSNFHFSHFCLSNGGTVSSQGRFMSPISQYSYFSSNCTEEI